MSSAICVKCARAALFDCTDILIHPSVTACIQLWHVCTSLDVLPIACAPGLEPHHCTNLQLPETLSDVVVECGCLINSSSVLCASGPSHTLRQAVLDECDNRRAKLGEFHFHLRANRDLQAGEEVGSVTYRTLTCGVYGRSEDS